PYDSKPTPKCASTGRRTQGNQTGNASAMTTRTRHATPRTLNNLFFLDRTAVMPGQCSQPRPECLFDSPGFTQMAQGVSQQESIWTLERARVIGRSTGFGVRRQSAATALSYEDGRRESKASSGIFRQLSRLPRRRKLSLLRCDPKPPVMKRCRSWFPFGVAVLLALRGPAQA